MRFFILNKREGRKNNFPKKILYFQFHIILEILYIRILSSILLLKRENVFFQFYITFGRIIVFLILYCFSYFQFYITFGKGNVESKVKSKKHNKFFLKYCPLYLPSLLIVLRGANAGALPHF